MLSLLLASALTFLFSWNNGSLLLGGLTASGVIRFRLATLLLASAMVLGILAEGWKVSPESLTAPRGFSPALATALIIFAASNLLDIPVSLSNIAVGALVGSSLALGLGVNVWFLAGVAAAWLSAPFFAMLLAHVIYSASRLLLRRVGLLTLDLVNRLAAYLITFYSAYSLSANNVGFILNMASAAPPSLAAVSAASALGVILFTRKSSFAMGERLLILSPQRVFTSLASASIILWFLTQVGVPGALTQTLLGGFLGSTASSPLAIINTRLVRRFVVGWVAAALLSVPAGYGFALLLT